VLVARADGDLLDLSVPDAASALPGLLAAPEPLRMRA
jgi:hypothetical protein